VWWPPTDDENRTDYAGAYWPVSVLKVLQTGYKVRYDNGESENIREEHVHPNDPPVEFGEEQIPLQVSFTYGDEVFPAVSLGEACLSPSTRVFPGNA
jgi:hypothetical protein